MNSNTTDNKAKSNEGRKPQAPSDPNDQLAALDAAAVNMQIMHEMNAIAATAWLDIAKAAAATADPVREAAAESKYSMYATMMLHLPTALVSLVSICQRNAFELELNNVGIRQQQAQVAEAINVLQQGASKLVVPATPATPASTLFRGGPRPLRRP